MPPLFLVSSMQPQIDLPAARFGNLKAFYKQFHGTGKKTPEQIGDMLITCGFQREKSDTFRNADGVKIHIDPHNHHKHIDVHVPGRKKNRVSYFA